MSSDSACFNRPNWPDSASFFILYHDCCGVSGSHGEPVLLNAAALYAVVCLGKAHHRAVHGDMAERCGPQLHRKDSRDSTGNIPGTAMFIA